MILDRLGVITDEVSDDFQEALDWIRSEGLNYAELRVIDGKNISHLNDDEVMRVKEQLDKRGLRVSAIASPIFKCALDPARPVASGDRFGQEEAGADEHFEMLHRTIEIAKRVDTRFIRIFSFWREKNPESYFDEIVQHLSKAAQIAEQAGIMLVLENEGSCNGGLAEETAALVTKVNSPNLKVLWDPGNERARGLSPYPEGYQHVKHLLAHVHLKDAAVKPGASARCVPIGQGEVPYREQFQALISDGYDGLYVIETHYVPEGGTKKDGTKQTLDGIRAILKQLE